MLILGINTAWGACEAALARDGVVIENNREEMARGQDSRLATFTAALMAAAGVAFGEIDRIAVVSGPGSFTGVRIGLAFARGLALALDRPALGVNSLEAALPIGAEGEALVLLPAQRRAPDITYWAQRFRDEAAIDAAAELPLEAIEPRGATVYGAALAALTDRLPRLKTMEAAPSAAIAARRAADADPARSSATAVYLRPPDARPASR